MTEPTPSVVRADPRAIPDTLKEAVVDGLLNAIAGRLAGDGEPGRVVFGMKPRYALSSGFLLPFDPGNSTDDVSTSIRISGHGLDFLIRANSNETIDVHPRASVYVRVFPTKDEILNHPQCDPRFALKKEIQRELRSGIRARLKEEQAKLPLGRKDPKWRETELRVRQEVHKRLGVPFGVEVSEETVPAAGEGEASASEADEWLISGRASLSDDLATEAGVPPKWLRIDVQLPKLSFNAANVQSQIAASNAEIKAAVLGAIAAWAASDDPDIGGKKWGYRRVRKIRPSDVRDWDRFLTEVRSSRLEVLGPTDLRLEWDVELSPDLADSSVTAVHIALENRSEESDSSRKYNESELAAFQVSLEVIVPATAHRKLMLDRVEPSYRYYRYLEYPALGFNGGVVAAPGSQALTLKTTWAPRYNQPRIIPVSYPGLDMDIEALSRPENIKRLRALVDRFGEWQQNIRSFAFDAGLDKSQSELIEHERRQFEADKLAWKREFAALDAGVRILEESAKYWKAPGTQADQRAAPFEAWLAMNNAMSVIAKKKGFSSWHLFQVSFILANIPALVTRMPAFHKYYTVDSARYAEAVTLLYFATGGGKSEAFLGLLTFGLLLDRLRGKERGVSAIVRYPLRLLTLQQAQRTARVLAQAELIRRSRGIGGEPFSVGFWVGSSNTPNSLRDEGVSDIPEVGTAPAAAEQALLESRDYPRALERWNKLPQCPFCAASTGLRRFAGAGGLLGHLCLNEKCPWNEAHADPAALPFFIVDDDIYEYPPSVLLGTVDKLALIGQSQRTIRRFLGMFGFAAGYKADTGRLYLPDPRKRSELAQPAGERPFVALFPSYANGEKRFFDPFPSLLIQDEAHLLDESLGTFAGLFETALDAALDRLAPLLGSEIAVSPNDGQRRRVKVIAASATVRDPHRQMRNIYQRDDTVQFPHPGPELYKSFYAIPKGPAPDELERLALPADDIEGRSHWGRTYASFLTNGHTHTVTVVEVLATFHVVISELYAAVSAGDPGLLASGKSTLVRNLTSGPLRPLFGRAIEGADGSVLATLIDLHRIALTYVTNKKGGDQIIAAEEGEFAKKHRAGGMHGYKLQTDLITGAVDAGRIQAVIRRAESRAAVGKPLGTLSDSLRSVVATSAVSHGVDVEELNSMFFAGMPSDIAEYIQASSRVGRTHVGFSVLIPTPQRARDRYIVEVHDIFHRFLERMIAPAAIDRWAEKAVERVISSFLQAYLAGVRAVTSLAKATDSDKAKQRLFKDTDELTDATREAPMAFKRDVAAFIESATGLRLPFSPKEQGHYEALIRTRVNEICDDAEQPRFRGGELRNYLTTRNIDLRPMMSLRDVDKPGRIVPSNRDGHDKKATDEQIARAMRLIRGGSGSDLDDEADEA